MPRAFLALPSPRARLGPAWTLQSSPSAWPLDDFAGSLRQALTAYLGDGYPPIELGAALAGCSVRTLQRRLASVSLTYSDVIDQTRYHLATQMLHDSDAKLIEVAYELGYAEPSCLPRAFRRWAGVTPRDYRRQQLIAS